MTIVLSHMTALRYWLSRPANAARLRRVSAALPAKGVTKLEAKQLDAIAAPPLHVLCSKPVKGEPRHGVVHHTRSAALPAGALFRITKSVAVCSPELAFLQCAKQLTLVDLVRLGFELCGTYSLDRASDSGFFKRQPITTPEKLRAVVGAASRARGVDNAARALPHVLANAASPAETRLAMALSLPNRLGGLGLPAPQLNYRIALPAYDRALLNRGCFLCDLYWPQARLAVEYDSDAFHATPERLASDSSRRNALEHVGVTVITVTARTYRDYGSFKTTGGIIAKRLDVEMRPRCRDYEAKRLRLRRELDADPPWIDTGELG